MKKELFPGVEVSYKKFDDVKVDGFVCSLYVSEPLRIKGNDDLFYSAYIVPLRYKDNKARYPIYLKFGVTEKCVPENYMEEHQLVRLFEITEYDGFATPEFIAKRFYQCFVNKKNEMMRYSKKHFALHCKVHGVKVIG